MQQDPSAFDRLSVTDKIVSTLAARIVRGEIAPGSRLLQDRIAEEFGVSHVPVREAFRKLEAQGLARNEPRRGVTVPPLEAQGIEELVLMREALETAALREAMRREPGRPLDAARQWLREGEKAKDVFALEHANQEFHRELVRPCGMPRLLAAIDELHRSSARYLFACWDKLNWKPRSNKEHQALLEAVARGDADTACTLLRDHIREAGASLVAALARQAAPKGGR
jgi:DNA-binding GntR family transcriptional regulator